MRISLIATVKDAGPFIGEFLASVAAQTRQPDEIVIVDGGSTDGTVEALRRAEDVTLIEEPGANISRGRARAIASATFDVIAVSDADCVLDPDWLERLAKLIEDGADVAMGFYRPIVENFFQACSAAVHLPDPDELDEAKFMPSSRSVAFKRQAYESAGGYPEWLAIGEDMYLNHRWRETGMQMRLDPAAVANWRVRPNVSSTWRQYFGYARGDAIAGMWPKRHAVRFATYGTAAVLCFFAPGRILLAVGAVAYAFRPVRRSFGLLPGEPLKQVGAVVGVPSMMAFTDVAKMAGYISGSLQTRRG
jgi:glycosyltransferase involved in cell wall biosynthesis